MVDLLKVGWNLFSKIIIDIVIWKLMFVFNACRVKKYLQMFHC